MVSIALPSRILLIHSVATPFPCSPSALRGREERVFFSDQETHEVRSLPLAWTNLSLPDPFLVVAAGKAVLRWKDLQQLTQFLRQQQSHSQEGH
jgi:Family of unknown function (DUF5372)